MRRALRTAGETSDARQSQTSLRFAFFLARQWFSRQRLPVVLIFPQADIGTFSLPSNNRPCKPYYKPYHIYAMEQVQDTPISTVFDGRGAIVYIF